MLNLKEMISDVFVHIFNLESPLIRSVIALFKRPSFVIQNYLQGNKGYYFSPSKMLFYAMLEAGLFLSIMAGPKRLFGLYFDIEGIAPQLAFVLTLIPFVSFFSWITHFRSNKKILYHLLASIYVISFSTLVFVVLEFIIERMGLLSPGIETIFLILFVLTIHFLTACVWEKGIWKRMQFTILHLLLSALGLFLLVQITAYLFPGTVHV